jgi:hypothetical protein
LQYFINSCSKFQIVLCPKINSLPGYRGCVDPSSAAVVSSWLVVMSNSRNEGQREGRGSASIDSREILVIAYRY